MSDAPADRRRPMRKLLLAAPVLLFVLLAGLLVYRLLNGGDPAVVPSALLGRLAPALTLPPLDGLLRRGVATPGVTPADFGGDRVTIVNVWASWCGPCRVEHPMLLELSRRGDVRMVGVNYKDASENARRFLGQLGDPFDAVGVDRDGSAVIDWGVYGVPETFIVDGGGRIRHRHVGPLTPEALNGSFGKALAAAAR